MKQALKELIGYNIETKDGVKGTVKDFLFDEDKWVVRYLVADLGLIFPGKKVIIPKVFLKQPDWTNERFPIELTTEQLKNCPPLDENLPISREYERALHRHYKIEDYWRTIYLPPMGVGVITYPPRPIKVPDRAVNETELATSIRSFEEIKGYHIQAIDKKIGHIDDLVVDDLDWQVVYALVDTQNWVPWSKRVLIGTHWMEEISYVEEKVIINLDAEAIESAPEYNFSEPITDEYEKQLHNYYESSHVEH